jgi:EmrB/QacA subfamily drug resistance transporter
MAFSATRIAPTVATEPHPRRWLVAAVMMVAALMDLLDVTVVNVALPTIQSELHASPSALAWVVSGYLLAFAALLLVAGQLGDMLGRRRLFLIGIGGFGLASLACALARNAGELDAFRAVQGAAAAIMVPQVLATFRTVFAGKERAAAFGMYGAVAGLASALGLVVGGAVISADLFGWGWRAVFAVNVPIAVASFAAALLLVPETRPAAPPRPQPIGAALLASCLAAIVYPLLEGQRLGWPGWGWAMLGSGIVGLLLFGLVERRDHGRHASPLLNPRMLRIPAVGAGLLVQLAFSFGLQGFFFVFALWLQSGQRYTALHAGLVTIAFSLGSIVLSAVSIQLAPRLGRWILVAGGLLMALGATLICLVAQHSGHGIGVWQLVPGLFIAGAGLALLIVPLVNVVLAAVPAEVAGSASGVFSTAQQLGGALGVAITGAVFFSQTRSAELTGAFTHAMPVVIAVFLAAALLALTLPRTAVTDVY